MSNVSAGAVEYLKFFRRWDTPLDERAVKKYVEIVRQEPSYESFRQLCPPASETRMLIERFFGSFNEAGGLIRDGHMNENLFFDAWYEMPSSWNRAQPYVEYLRRESADSELHERFEWLAERAAEFWAERERNPPVWHPLTDSPTTDDEAVLRTFNATWSAEADTVARNFVAELEREAPRVADMLQRMQPGTDEFLKFDRVLCAYDQAGTLVKNAILHPALFFRAWRLPSELWSQHGSFILAIREHRNLPHLWENIDWLVAYELARGL